jgi:fatty acid CoA ligase FadD9
MTTDSREERLQRRIADLYATDPQFAAARPDGAVSDAIDRPGLRLARVVQTVTEGYPNRPALGQRAVQFVKDPCTGRTSAQLLPSFDTVTYRELWDRAGSSQTRCPTIRCGPAIACVSWVSRAPTTPPSTWL